MARASPDPYHILRGCTDAVSSVVFLCPERSPSKQPVLLSGDNSGHVHVWDLCTYRVVSKVTAHAGHSMLCVKPLCDAHVLTQGRDGVVHKWDVGQAEWSLLSTLRTGSNGFCKCATAGVDKHILAHPVAETSAIEVTDLKSLQTMCRIQMPETEKTGMVMAIKFIHNEGKLLAAYENGTLKLWDMKWLSTGKPVNSIQLHEDALVCFDFHEESKKGFSGSVDNLLLSWSIDNQDKMNVLRKTAITNEGINDVVIRPDGVIVATAGWDSQIRLFGCKKTKPLAVLNYHSQSIQCLSYGWDGNLAAGSRDKLISLWNLYK